MQHGLADRLGRDGAGVDADAADAGRAVDQRDALAELGGAERRLLPGGAGADDDEVIQYVRCHLYGLYRVGKVRG